METKTKTKTELEAKAKVKVKVKVKYALLGNCVWAALRSYLGRDC
jgi:hypothetical protein